MSKKIYNNIYSLLAVLMIATAMSSCASKKAVEPEYQPQTQTQTGTRTQTDTQTEPVVAKEWQDLYVPVSFNLRSPKNFSLSGRATMIRDKEITISLRFLGMEVAVLDITPTAITAIDKYHRMALTEHIEHILQDHNLTIADLQDALLGKASEKIMKKLDSTPVNVTYGPMVSTPEGDMTRYVTVSARIAGMPVEFELSYKPDKAEWNSGRTVNVTIPSNYKIIDARSLIENLGINL